MKPINILQPWKNCGKPQCENLTNGRRCNQPVDGEHKCYYHHNFVKQIAKTKPGRKYFYPWEGSKDDIL